MAKVLIGNFKGPKGDTGAKGDKGDKGEQGDRGSRWTEGTAITGSSTTPTVFSGTGITDALAEDLYLNTDTGNVYRCTTAGTANVAKWVYACNIKGIKGDTGSKGDKGDKGEQGEKGDTGAQGPKGDTPTVADDMTVAFTEADSRTNIASGENTATLFGKIKKFFADLTAPAFAQMITSKDDLLATKATGYVPDAKAVADAVTDVNSKLQRETLNNIEWFASWNIEPFTTDIYKCNNHIDGIVMWQNVTATKDNLNRCIIANTRYHPTNIAIVYGYGANGSVYYPLAGWIDTNGDLFIVPQHNLELKYITIKFDYYT